MRSHLQTQREQALATTGRGSESVRARTRDVTGQVEALVSLRFNRLAKALRNFATFGATMYAQYG